MFGHKVLAGSHKERQTANHYALPSHEDLVVVETSTHGGSHIWHLRLISLAGKGTLNVVFKCVLGLHMVHFPLAKAG